MTSKSAKLCTIAQGRPGLVDFAIIGLINSVLDLPDRQLKFFGVIQITEVL